MTGEFPFQHIDQTSAIFKNLDQAIIGFNEKGEIDYFNPAAEKMFIYEADQAVGKNIQVLIPNITQLIPTKSASKNDKTEHPNITCYGKTGHQFSIHLTMIDVSVQSKKQYVCLIQEISKQKETGERQTVDFISMMSHELKTPLTSIIGYLDLLIEGDIEPNSDEHFEFLTIISENAILLDTIISDLSLINKIEREKIVLGKKRFDFSNLLMNMANTATESINEENMIFRHKIAPGIFFDGDEHLLNKAIYNILSNAINYTKEGTVEFKAVVEDQQITISIKDTGIGMSKADQRRLFTKFYRSDHPDVRSISGTGLGLVVANKIIEKYYGKIIAKSKLGEGSIFTIVLPHGE